MGNENLLLETIEVLNSNGKLESDILWVGCYDFYFTWEKFKEISKYANYDSGFGAQEVVSDLLVVGDDFWLDRWEYDGSEGWRFNTIPIKPEKYLEVNNLVGGMWCTIAELNDLEEL